MSMEAYLFWGLIFGSIGFGYFLYGKKRPNIIALVCGLALMVYPYVVSSTWAMVGIGVVLMAIPYFVRL
ncbi:MAG TPA: hypothetical protein VGT79_09310 [Xanthomonadaceae bacterium]|nr:hypothetical protein [Xanthomonadaceae bacterium]